jgi:hypothetical protein
MFWLKYVADFVNSCVWTGYLCTFNYAVNKMYVNHRKMVVVMMMMMMIIIIIIG